MMTNPDIAADQAARDAARAFQAKSLTADDTTLALLFTEARTHYGWQDRDVAEETLRELYEIAKMGPTSM
ncbi:MAG: nitroreductase family protein, partial [Pseudomonadota bacterium]